MTLPVMTLKKKRERSVLLRHPWIFTGAVQKMPDAGEGEIILVQDNKGQNLAVGFFSTRSQICCRLFHWTEQPVKYQDVAFWQEKINRAYELRKKVINFNTTNAYRLIAAEGDFLPGLIADVYNQVVVVQILIRGMERIQPLWVEALQQMGFKHIYHKAKRSSQILEDIRPGANWLAGSIEVPVSILENDLSFDIDFKEGQKTGFFLDQRENRALLRIYSKDKRILNAFSYTGGFSVYALDGGAQSVVSLDASQPAVEQAGRHVEMNFPGADHQVVEADCFDFLKNMGQDEFDLIVLDPPAFAKHARAVKQASRGYKQINLQAMRKIRPGGLIFTFSCSQNVSNKLFRQILFGAAADSGRDVRIIHQLHQAPDHPVNIYHPEGEYLKGYVLEVL